VARRLERKRCAEVIHEELRQRGVAVSLSSVKRTLDRRGLTRKRSPWQRWHRSLPRPAVEKPGDLVEIDTIHVVPRRGQRFYIYTLLDVCSRWAFAKATPRINTHRSLRFVREAQTRAPFSFGTLQSDHGPEFSAWFTEHVRKRGLTHRHSRVRRPNDNGHLERFNRTVQEECRFRFLEQTVAAHQRALDAYLPYYNGERPHLGLNLKTPLQVMPSY
jgi:transposase InsO family protein